MKRIGCFKCLNNRLLLFLTTFSGFIQNIKNKCQSYPVSRPLRVLFFDSSSHRAGRQDFCNRVAHTSKLLTFDWHYIPLNPDLLRIKLKNCLFKYPTTDRITAPMSTSRSSNLPGNADLCNQHSSSTTTKKKR